MLTIIGNALGRTKPLFEDFSVPLPPDAHGDGGTTFRQRISLPDVVACFPNRDTQELLIISGNGSVSRVRQAV